MTSYPPEPPESTPGGYPPPSSGGYAPPPSSGGYAPPPSSGGFAPPPTYGSPPAAQQWGQASSAQQGGAYGGAPSGLPAGSYASWGQRATGALIDYAAPVLLALIVTVAISDTLGWLLYVAGFGWAVYNSYLGGETGQSFGKKQAGITLLSEETGRPIGGGMGIARYFIHIIDSVPCVPVGYLWPLWDPKRQTFTDKVLKTVVVTK